MQTGRSDNRSMAASPLWESIQLTHDRDEDDILKLLHSIPVFESIPDRGLKLIRSLCHIRYYKEDEHVFRTGEPGVGMYIILEGNVEIYRNEGDSRREYAMLESGDFLGELALLEDMPRSASARATSYSRLLGFFRPDLTSLISRKPRLANIVLMNIARLLGRRLIRTNEQLEMLISAPIGTPGTSVSLQSIDPD